MIGVYLASTAFHEVVDHSPRTVFSQAVQPS